MLFAFAFSVFVASAALLIYAVIGYPALMAGFGALVSRSRSVDETHLPSVTLIIPAHNEEAVIEAKLENTLRIDYPAEKLNVLVVSDGSEDKTVEIAKRYESEQVSVLDFRERRGKTSIVNDAMEQASGDVVCLCDTNVMFRPDAIRVMAGRLTDENVGAVSGDVRLASEESDFGAGESLYYGFERAMQLGESLTGSMIGVDGGMYVLRKELFLPPPAECILDDFVISVQVVMQGKKVVYEPDAIATENGTPSSEIEFRRRVRVTAGAIQTLRWRIWPSPVEQPIAWWQWMSHKLIRWMSPIWLILILLSSIILGVVSAPFQVVLIPQLALYSLAVLGGLLPSTRRLPVIGICFYFCLSQVAMLRGLERGIRNQQRVTWKRTQRAGG